MEENAWQGSLPEFRHAELDSNSCIRLIQIHAELFRGDISCTLQHYETDTRTCPDYAALSYSLWEFLSHSRTKKDTERTWLWTDLLCIDQAHHSEKNEQISRMGDIYAQAAYVISWLGTNEKAVEALRTLVEISDETDPECAPKFAWSSPQSEQIHKACDQLAFREPYWERVWVLQEVACARKCIVACGDTSVNFDDLLHKMEIAMKRSVRFDDSSDRGRRMKRIEALADLKTSIQQGKTIKILELIEKTSFCQATRSRDRIYGLLGLASRLDSGFDSRALDVSQRKSLVDVWWDIIFMISDQESNISIKNDLKALQNLVERLPPPRKFWEYMWGSSMWDAHAWKACMVSEAVYSSSIQAFLGILYSHREHDATLRYRQRLQKAWDIVTTHVYDHEEDVPGLQTSLGWCTYAGLRFASWYSNDLGNSFRKRRRRATFLPFGWFCAAHSPESPSNITAKHPIIVTSSIKAPPEDRSCPDCCSGPDEDDCCDLSLVVLKIETLGVTCLVRSADRVQIDFYCDCCDPSAASVEPPHNAPWLPRSSSPPLRSISDILDDIDNKGGSALIRKEMRESGELQRIRRRKEPRPFKLLSLSDYGIDDAYWTAPSSSK